MKKISCNVIKDLIPLYVDDVVSEETKELVDEHIASCESCHGEVESMGKTISIPTNSEGTQIKKLKRNINKRKAITICVSSFITLLVVFCLFAYLTFFGNAVNSDDVNVKIEFQYEEDTYLNQSWVIHFDLKNDKPLNVLTKNNYVLKEDGTKDYTGVTLYLREVPVGALFEANKYTIGYAQRDSYMTGFSYGDVDGNKPSDDFDYTFTVVYEDKEVVYSMREEGLFEKQENAVKYW